MLRVMNKNVHLFCTLCSFVVHIYFFKHLPAGGGGGGDFHLLNIFANSFEPDQARQNLVQNLDLVPSGLAL